LPVAGESIDDQLSRPMILSAALYAQNTDAIAAAHQIFKDNQTQLATLSADIRGLILTNEVKHYGSEKLFDQLLADYQQTADGSYKANIRAALTSTPDAGLIKETIAQFENADVIKPQDLRGWFRGVLANPHGEQAAWDWLRTDWQWLEDTVGGDMEFSTYITVTAGVFKTADRLAEFKAFLNQNSIHQA
jgi:hypothetical protein